MGKPDVDSIEGLSPAISIEQKAPATIPDPRSAHRHGNLRLPPSPLARVGRPSCFQCGEEITAQTVQQMVDAIGLLPEGSKFQAIGPNRPWAGKAEYRKELLDMRRAGYVRARVDGQLVDLGEDIALDKQKKHTIEIVVDRLVMKAGEALQDGWPTPWRLAETRRWAGRSADGRREGFTL